MENNSAKQFNARWEESLKEPALVEIKVKKLEVDFSLSTTLERYMSFAEKSMSQGKISREDFDDLSTHANNMMDSLNKIRDKSLVSTEISKRAKRISKKLHDRIDRIRSGLDEHF